MCVIIGMAVGGVLVLHSSIILVCHRMTIVIVRVLCPSFVSLLLRVLLVLLLFVLFFVLVCVIIFFSRFHSLSLHSVVTTRNQLSILSSRSAVLVLLALAC